MRKIVGIALAGVLVVALGAAAVAQESPSPKPGTERREGAKRPQAKLGFRVIHSDAVGMKADGSTVDVRTQKGIIDEVDADSITLTSPDGYKQTYAINNETVVREKREASTVGDLKAGEMARVVAVKAGDGYTAKLINCTGEPGPRLKALQEKARAQ
jgi:thioredoxin reductase